MNKKKTSLTLILLLMFTLFIAGCSMLPKLNFNKGNVLPQSTEKSSSSDVCKGETKFNEMGDMIYCSDGYYAKASSFNKKERKTTMKERVINFLSNLIGWSFWIFLGILVFAPGFLGFLFGKLIEGTVGLTGKALKSTVKAISRAKKNGGNFMKELDIEHNKHKGVQKKINHIRSDE